MCPVTRKISRLTPFLKWAGGKRWLADNHDELLKVKCKRFIEPFLGSGAVFFKLLPTQAILSDRNEQLIETYLAIKEEHKKVKKHLQKHHRLHDRDYYYEVRQQKPRSMAGRAAQFIYLNRTCWNGLYRVNLDGVFNVPVGTKTNVILETDDFEAVSHVLANVELRACDFEETLQLARRGDFVFVDPPYTVKHNLNGFIKYNEGLFSWEDQMRLRDCVLAASRRGAKVLVTNAYHSSVRKLYEGVGEITKVRRTSVIAGNSEFRKKCNEMVVKCF